MNDDSDLSLDEELKTLNFNNGNWTPKVSFKPSGGSIYFDPNGDDLYYKDKLFYHVTESILHKFTPRDIDFIKKMDRSSLPLTDKQRKYIIVLCKVADGLITNRNL